jgi:hypothetical protein
MVLVDPTKCYEAGLIHFDIFTMMPSIKYESLLHTFNFQPKTKTILSIEDTGYMHCTV